MLLTLICLVSVAYTNRIKQEFPRVARDALKLVSKQSGMLGSRSLPAIAIPSRLFHASKNTWGWAEHDPGPAQIAAGTSQWTGAPVASSKGETPPSDTLFFWDVLSNSEAPVYWLHSSILQAALDKHIINEREHKLYTGIHHHSVIEKSPLSEEQTQVKDWVEFKVSMHAAKDKKVLNDVQYKFVMDIFGKAPDALSEKQQALKQQTDLKLEAWRASRIGAISDKDLDVGISDIIKDAITAHRDAKVAHELSKEHIAKQMEIVTDALDDQVLTPWEVGFFKSTFMKKDSQLSEKQRPVVDLIKMKLQAWRAHRSGLLNESELNFVKAIGLPELSAEEQSRLEDIDEKMRILSWY